MRRRIEERMCKRERENDDGGDRVGEGEELRQGVVGLRR